MANSFTVQPPNDHYLYRSCWISYLVTKNKTKQKPIIRHHFGYFQIYFLQQSMIIDCVLSIIIIVRIFFWSFLCFRFIFHFKNMFALNNICYYNVNYQSKYLTYIVTSVLLSFCTNFVSGTIEDKVDCLVNATIGYSDPKNVYQCQRPMKCCFEYTKPSCCRHKPSLQIM